MVRGFDNLFTPEGCGGPPPGPATCMVCFAINYINDMIYVKLQLFINFEDGHPLWDRELKLSKQTRKKRIKS